MRKLFMPYANNKGAGQPVHPHSLISAFVVRCLGSIIPQRAKSKFFKTLASLCSWSGRLVSYLVANPPKCSWSGRLVSYLVANAPKTGFSLDKAYISVFIYIIHSKLRKSEWVIMQKSCIVSMNLSWIDMETAKSYHMKIWSGAVEQLFVHIAWTTGCLLKEQPQLYVCGRLMFKANFWLKWTKYEP